MDTTINDIAFQLILFAGNGKSFAMEAIQAAKKGDFESADNLIKKAGKELGQAHEFQTKLLQQEANGEANQINVFLIHSQDHLMTALTLRDLAVEIIEIYRNK
ncbi:PTS lactose/cellobiose transporter subunit IIA [Aneurinibacillus terranovensis]|uniref:PTS lactose/cellobiose transporter subunit IIA n=1 Tax=Aneurinibacillus terranovensis TaxID=278991 RepID=UPI000427DB8B|nr:PTS lactose/cellobiose transporter subunit IIA [Aneurinibacillus terranovensis]